MSEAENKLNNKIIDLDAKIKNTDSRYATLKRKINGKKLKEEEKDNLKTELKNVEEEGIHYIKERNKIVEQLYGGTK